jgi:hypothetical protein
MKNMNEIRALLSNEIEKLQNKTTTPASLNAIVNATGKIISTIKMELEYARLVGKSPALNGFIAVEEKPALPPASDAK